MLNKHFAEVGTSNKNSINYQGINKYLKHGQSNTIFLSETNNTELLFIIENLKNKKSQGPDEVPISIIKKLKNLICPILTYLINKSLKLGEYPNCLKIGKVLPLYKSGNRMDPSNYRPIILLPAINKIYETLLVNRLASFFESNKIITDNQYGFRSGHSTEQAISKFYEDILVNLNNNFSSCAIVLDLSKAFDSVNREILLYKLNRYGIRGPFLKILTSYLNNRTQYVHTNDIKSTVCQSIMGVPQGSIISTQFLIMINDFKNSTNMDVLKFADDTLFYLKFSETTNLQEQINTELHKINEWLELNHLKPNLAKTYYLIFPPKTKTSNSITNLNLSLDNKTKIKQVKNFKYLGLNIEHNLTWKTQIESLTCKLSKAIGILYRIRRYINKPSLNLLLHSLIISHLKYGIICYGRANSTALKPLNILLNRALRCINFLGRRDKKTSQIYFEQKILKIQDMFKLELAKFCFKFHNKLLPNQLLTVFTNISSVHNYNTMNSNINFFSK